MKKIDYAILVSMMVALLSSCEKSPQDDEGLSNTHPEVPEKVIYDLNSDQEYDFELDYLLYTWDGINSSGDLYSGDFKALNQSLILGKANDFSLFLNYGDTIRNEIEAPYYWDDYMVSIVAISTKSDAYVWEKEWTILSDQQKETYFLGTKILKDNIYSIGWLKLQINTSTGVVDIIEKKFSDNDFILAGK